MRLHALLVAGAASLSSDAFGAGKHPPHDVAAFIRNAEACEHLGGEYDGELPKQSKDEIRGDIRRYCGAAQRQLATLRKKYAHDATMLEVVNCNANDAVKDYR